MLGDIPTRTLSSVFTAVPSNQKLSGQLFTLRSPLRRMEFLFQIERRRQRGHNLGSSLAGLRFLGNRPIVRRFCGGQGHISKTDLLYGPYVGATLRYDFTHRWGVYLGAQFQRLTDMELSSGAHTAKLDPGATVYLTAGLSYKF